MPISIKDPETERLARALAKKTGETITVATKRALEERLNRLVRVGDPFLLRDLEEIRLQWAALPILDDRTPEEIIGNDDNGLPT